MKILKILVIWVPLFSLYQTENYGQAGNIIRCEASAVRLLEEGQITCLYNKDLNQIEGIVVVSIEFYRHNATSDVPVIDCLWEGIHNCANIRQGYRVTKVTGMSMEVTISHVTSAHLGRYRCSKMDSVSNFHSEFCTLRIDGATLRDRTTRPTASVEEQPDMSDRGNGAVVPDDQAGPLLMEADPDQSDERNNSEEGLSGGAVAGIVVGVLIPVLIIAVIGAIYWARFRHQKNAKYVGEGDTVTGKRDTGSNEDTSESPLLHVKSLSEDHHPLKGHRDFTQGSRSEDEEVNEGKADTRNGSTGAREAKEITAEGKGTGVEARSTEEDRNVEARSGEEGKVAGEARRDKEGNSIGGGHMAGGGGNTTPVGGNTTSVGGITTLGGGNTTPGDGNTTPVGKNMTHRYGNTTHRGGNTTRGGRKTTPGGGITTHGYGNTTHRGGNTTRRGGNTTHKYGNTTHRYGNTTHGGRKTTLVGGITTHVDGNTTHRGGNTTPGGGITTLGGGNTTPGGGNTTRGGRKTTRGGRITTPGGGNTTPGGGNTTLGGGNTTPGGGNTTLGGGITTPGGGDTTHGGGNPAIRKGGTNTGVTKGISGRSPLGRSVKDLVGQFSTAGNLPREGKPHHHSLPSLHTNRLTNTGTETII